MVIEVVKYLISIGVDISVHNNYVVRFASKNGYQKVVE